VSGDATLTVTFQHLSKSEIIALQQFFGRWEWYGKAGASREVSFYVDGDGPFHPSIGFEVDGVDVDDVPDEVREVAEYEPNSYDFDAVHAALRETGVSES